MSTLDVARSMYRSPGSALLLASLLALASTGCDDSLDRPQLASETDAPPPSSEPPEAALGTLSFELRTADDVSLSSFDYVITGPNFSRTGSIDVSSSNTFSARIDGLPAAPGYAVTVSGNSVGEPVAHCSGAAAFDIVARSVQNVPVAISCRVEHEAPPGPVQAPLPPVATWLCGLSLLGLGLRFTSRSRSPRRG